MRPVRVIDLFGKALREGPCEVVIIGTQMDLGALLKITKPAVRLAYPLQEQPADARAASIADVPPLLE